MGLRYFAFFAPSSQPQYFAIRARSRKDIQHFIDACSHHTDKPKPKDKEVWYIGELSPFEVEEFSDVYKITDFE